MENNLKIFSDSVNFLKELTSFGVIEQGRFEYKMKDDIGNRMQGEYYINFRMLNTEQELILIPYYIKAIKEFFREEVNDLIIVGVASASITLPKAVQLEIYKEYKIEFAYTEKVNGVLAFDAKQKEKLMGKHILFIEDVCNNGASLKELNELVKGLDIKKYSILYGLHRGHTFSGIPEGEIYAMCSIFAPSYTVNNLPENLKDIPLKKYKI